MALAAHTAPPATATSSVGARGAADAGLPGWPLPPAGTYLAPVEGPVIDPFRLDHGHYGPGNRGLEYATSPGRPAHAVAAGQVVFAGAVAGRLAVSVVHADGRRSSLTGLASVVVTAGQLVPRGGVLGTTGETLHLGVREGGRYVDPARLLRVRRARAVLVPAW